MSGIREDVAKCYLCDYCREINGVDVKCAYGSGIYPWLEYLVKMCFGHRDLYFNNCITPPPISRLESQGLVTISDPDKVSYKTEWAFKVSITQKGTEFVQGYNKLELINACMISNLLIRACRIVKELSFEELPFAMTHQHAAIRIIAKVTYRNLRNGCVRRDGIWTKSN